MNFKSIITLFSLFCAVQFIEAANIRFLNNIEGQTITIQTDALGSLTLPYQSISPYTAVSNPSISVISVMNVGGSGYSYTNTSIAITLVDYTTVAATFKNGEFYLVMFNETTSSAMTDGTNSAWVRFIDLTEFIPFLSVNSNSQTLWSYVGYLEATPFVAVDPSITTSFIATQSGTSNTYPISMDSSLSAGSVYTICVFATSTGPQGIVYLDRSFAPQAALSTTTTGNVVDSTSTSSTSSETPMESSPMMSTSSTSERAHYNSAGKIQTVGFGLFSILIVLVAL